MTQIKTKKIDMVNLPFILCFNNEDMEVEILTVDIGMQDILNKCPDINMQMLHDIFPSQTDMSENGEVSTHMYSWQMVVIKMNAFPYPEKCSIETKVLILE